MCAFLNIELKIMINSHKKNIIKNINFYLQYFYYDSRYIKIRFVYHDELWFDATDILQVWNVKPREVRDVIKNNVNTENYIIFYYKNGKLFSTPKSKINTKMYININGIFDVSLHYNCDIDMFYFFNIYVTGEINNALDNIKYRCTGERITTKNVKINKKYKYDIFCYGINTRNVIVNKNITNVKDLVDIQYNFELKCEIKNKLKKN